MRTAFFFVVLALCLTILFSSTCLGESGCNSQRSICPTNGFIPDESTAVDVAEAILIPIYGRKHVNSERPFTARLEENHWIVRGNLAKPRHPGDIVVGGTMVAEIDKQSGRILAVYHLK